MAWATEIPADNTALFAAWAKARKPMRGPASAIGSYSAGCLKGGVPLKKDGVGYSVMRLSRHRHFGHPNLVNYIETLGRLGKKARLPLLLVGDMGMARGGPMKTGHASHQSGLDVDIWFRLSKRRPSLKERESWGSPKLVEDNVRLTRGWQKNQRKLVVLAASQEEVDRIFVHPAIKADLCKKFPEAPWLVKVRPWWGHDDHLHVRLKCPPGNTQCEPQAPLTNSECGTELAWWFSEEAKTEWEKKRAAIGRDFPRLPETCSSLVAEFLAHREQNP